MTSIGQWYPRGVKVAARVSCALAMCAAMCAAGACGGGDDDGAPPDGGGPPGGATLEVLTPPGESIPLAFGDRIDLRVRYSDPDGEAVAGVAVTFVLRADPAQSEDPGGATLGASEALTDETGTARTSLTAGASRTHFRVEASAPKASVATFYVTVSDAGFAELVVTPRHVGDRAVDDFAVVELRLYGDEQSCATLDPTMPAPSAYPPRSMDRFDEPASFGSLLSGVSYRVLAWGRNDAGHVLAAGCTELDAAQVPPLVLLLDVAVSDWPLHMADAYAIVSTIDLTPVRDSIVDGPGRVWTRAGCPLGAAQLVLDCAIDLLDGGDPDDCMVAAPGPLAADLDQRRGAIGADGCRGATVPGPGGGPSLEAFVDEVLAAGPGSPSAALPIVAAAILELSRELTIESRFVATGWSIEHGLGAATIGGSLVAHTSVLPDSSRPVVTQTVGYSIDGDDLTIAPHGFTLRLGDLLEEAVDESVIAPLGFSTSLQELGSFIVGSAAADPLYGCDAVSGAACQTVGAAGDCLVDACVAALPLVDAKLHGPIVRLRAPGLDLQLGGYAILEDADGDLAAETLSYGAWSVDLVLDDGALLPIPATFTGAAE
jgi:hypothetical protein